ncbi:hypothetical protein FDF69_07905 [Clostridium sporogenes]|uniref:NACHT domain-containing protein n=1 Tax=Clostridium sporogenes TaxID=1509 RepID=UPI0013D2ECC4|nr:hypothetical protein [Clostridium sporogenes]NFF66821.1 hypothetical protein [Clostridium sporogenes]NFF99381.1 hypothetical protein [Clostridium sporogenes]NFG06889.1 hypothetical protein [Clostridium sporogenes]NFG51439.1 hypothetical protein [Clostridium sporogenes]NFP84783.1 hypothetical protein [Clostridium sporogenes]
MSQVFEEGLKLVVVAGVGEYIKAIVNTYIKPRLESKYKEDQSDKKFYLIEEKFNEYMKRSYNNNLYMSTIVFKNQQKIINDLYVPLTVSKCCTGNSKNDIDICINGYNDNFIPHHKKVLLVDTAGMGKSTILKYLYLSAITENKGIPVLIELRKLDKNTTIIDFIMNEINGIKKYFNKEDILGLIEEGGFIFFFDGYDEVTEEYKKEVTENLEDFISKTSTSRILDNNFIISSRDENELGCFGDFQRFEIKPLKKGEAYNLIRKYDNDGEVSSQLIKKLEEEENLKILNEFLVNPLMVSLLYKAFDFKGKIPYKKYVFYRQVYDALFEDHDMTKGGAFTHKKKSKLDIEDFHRMLRCLGYLTLAKGKINFNREELCSLLKEVKNRTPGVVCKESDIINDIIHSVPLFVEDGIQYKWVHKSFQEYFAASYICMDIKDKKSIILNKMAEHNNINKYYNVLDFCYDMDVKVFRNEIIYPMVCNFIKHYENAYKSKEFEDYSKKQLDIRKSITFFSDNIRICSRSLKEYENREEKFIDFFGEKFRKKGCRFLIKNDIIGISVENLHYISLVNLIYNKQVPIAYTEYINTGGRYISRILEEGYYKIDEEPTNILNDKETFDIINQTCLSAIHGLKDKVNLILNYDECLKFKKEVEIEKRSDEQDILLL